MDYQFRFNALERYRDELLEGVLLTLQLSLFTMAIGLVIGLVAATMKLSKNKPLRSVAIAYIEVFRNTPLLVQLFILFFGLPTLGLRMSANEAAVIGLSMNVGAYIAEIMRSGLQSVRHSQIEAAMSLGMKPYQILRYVTLFQAFKAAYPALTSQFVLLVLMTSVVSAIGGTELFHAAAFVESRTFRSFEVYLVVTLAYFVLALFFRASFAALYRIIFARRTSR
jgi:polar amino acid transport system permease protein